MHAMYEFGWKPNEWGQLSYDERMLVIAMIQVHAEDEKKAHEEAEAKAKKRRRA